MKPNEQVDAATFAADKRSVAWWGVLGAMFPLVTIPIAHLRKPSVPLHLLSAMPNDATAAVAFEAAYTDRLKRRQVKTAWLGFICVGLFYLGMLLLIGLAGSVGTSASERSDKEKTAAPAKPSRPVSPAKPSIRRKPTPPKAAPAANPKPAPKPKRRYITLREFNQLELGMSYKEVVKVLGREGKENSRMELLGTTTTSYEWGEGLGGVVILTFENDRLSNRMQFGLPEK